MKLLLITQRIDADDRNLAAHVRWLQEFAKNTEQVRVIAQSVGRVDLPENVHLISLGKENGASKLTQFIRLLGALQSGIAVSDAVLVLMVPMYVVLAAPFAWLGRKRIYLWYTHKHVPSMLRLAERLVHRVFSASKEGLKLKTEKAVFLGHAIDTDFFSPDPSQVRIPGKVITVGRITATKRLDLFIQVIGELGGSATLDFIGDPIQPEDIAFQERMKQEIRAKGWEQRIHFVGGMSPEKVRQAYQTAAAFVNASGTESLDKAVLEAMACECPIFVSNPSFQKMIPTECFVESSTPELFIKALRPYLEKPQGMSVLRSEVVTNHNIHKTLSGMIQLMRAEQK